MRTHLGTGKSGQSTFRRSLIAILNLEVRPRDSLGKPNSFRSYRGTDEAEFFLTDWILNNLKLGVIPTSDAVLTELEMLKKFNPPLNLKDIEKTAFTEILKTLRLRKAEEAKSFKA